MIALRPHHFYLTLSFLILVTSYNNCGKEFEFVPTEEALQEERQNFNTNSKLQIEGGAEFTNLKSVRLTLDSPRALEMKVSHKKDCSDGTWEAYSDSKAWILSQENKKVSVYVTFKNMLEQDSECISDDITHDNIRPTLTFNQKPGVITNQDLMSLSWQAVDKGSGISSGSCLSPSGDSASCKDSHSFKSGAEGSNEAVVQLKDRAGNISSPYSYTWLKDKTAPQVRIHSQPSNPTGSSNAELSFSGSDAMSGISNFYCRLGQNAPVVCSSPMTYSGLAGRAQSFAVYAVDKAGNQSETVAADWTIDTSAPDIRITQSPSLFSNSSEAIFAFVGSDEGNPISNFQCRLANSVFAPCGSPKTFSGLSPGEHTFEVRGSDSVGNQSSPVSYRWVVDQSAPIVKITSAPSAHSNQTTATFQWEAADAGSDISDIKCRLGAEAFVACPGLAKNFVNLEPGLRSFEVQATDRAGNTATAKVEWRIDLKAPSIRITAAPEEFTSSFQTQFDFIGTDETQIAGYECRMDGGAYAQCAPPADFDSLAPGGHSFFVRAVDLAGNVSEPATHSWTIDIAPPIIRVVSFPTALHKGDIAKVEFEVVDSGSGTKSVQCGLASQNGKIATCPAAHTHNLGAMTTGTYTYLIRAEDNLGNISVEELTMEVTDRPLVCDPFSPAGEKLCNGGLIGDIYYLDKNQVATFKALKNKTVDYFLEKGTMINALLNLKELAVITRGFTDGFPVRGDVPLKNNQGEVLHEYFALHMKSVLKLDPLLNEPGWYQFATISDDGSVVLMRPPEATESSVLISNDGDHSARMGCSQQALYVDDTTRLPIEVRYYQGPRTQIAMMMIWRKVTSVNVANDKVCGNQSQDGFFGPAPYKDFSEKYLWGQLQTRGWKVIGPTNLIAPPKN